MLQYLPFYCEMIGVKFVSKAIIARIQMSAFALQCSNKKKKKKAGNTLEHFHHKTTQNMLNLCFLLPSVFKCLKRS